MSALTQRAPTPFGLNTYFATFQSEPGCRMRLKSAIRRRSLLELHEFAQNRVVQSANPVVLIEKAPAHYAALINHEHRRLGNLAFRVVEIVSVDDLVICVRENREPQLEFAGELAALVGTIDADG